MSFPNELTIYWNIVKKETDLKLKLKKRKNWHSDLSITFMYK